MASLGEVAAEVAAVPGNKAIRQLEDRMASIEPGTLRHEALEAAKRFKTSWIDLGRILWTVYKEKKFREWGYLTFEAYCAKEIGIRTATAKKLLHSYYFLEKEEPTLLKKLTEEPPAKLPQAESVNLLRLFSRKQDVPSENYQKVRSYVLEKGADPSQVRQEVKSFLEASQSDPEAARAARRQTTLRRMVGTLKAMRMELDAAHMVPKKLLAEIESLAHKLEEILKG